MLKTKNILDETKIFLDKDISTFWNKDTLKLQNLIKYHSDLYYNKEKPIISDSDYDKLFKKLELLEDKFDIKDKQTTKIWAELIESSFKKVKHSRPMISLDNTYNEEDLKDFDERVKKNLENKTGQTEKNKSGQTHRSAPTENLNTGHPQGGSLQGNNVGVPFMGTQNIENYKEIEYTIEFKFDWLWIELIYKNWKLIQAITRGNWIEWEDVTQNVMQINNIPKEINYKNDLEVRGEIVMPISSFKELNKKALKSWDKVFSNPRNAASWSIRMKDNRITKERRLKFFAYDLANFDNFRKQEKIKKYYDIIKDLERFWFEISSYFKVCNWIKDIIKEIDNFWDKKKDLDFEIDGLVIKVNDIDLWEKIGWTQHHPRYAIAYKFPAEVFTTKIISVDHQVGRTWTITPVANLESVNMWGAIIKRATLHNYEEIENLWIAIWDYVFIKRAWEVIPKIISLAEKGIDRKEIEIPRKCPSCWEKIKKDDDKVRYFCDNLNCPAQKIEKLIYAVGKNWFDIDWLWEKQIKKFYELWFVKNLVDIFEIKKYKKEILNLEWFQEKSVNNIIKSIEKAKKIDINILINSLTITWVWKKTSKVLSSLFKSKKDLLNFNYILEDIEKLSDIGPEIAKNVFNFFNLEENKEILYKLVQLLDIKYFEEKTFNKDNFFFWKKVCITGSFIWIDWNKIKRDNLVEKLEQVWGNFVSSVSKNTDILLAWEKAGSKLKKANNLWIKVISLEEFLEKI